MPDVELMLHAYHAWAQDSVRYLLGDFAFAIWDARQGRLFCARDHFGVAHFCYTQVGDLLLFSNTLACLRQHPQVSADLNEQAVADYLLFNCNQDTATTFFSAIHQLPPAHTLTITLAEHGGLPQPQRYWHLPGDGHIRYRQAADYVEHFLEVFQVAVTDRLRTERVTVWMSGGMDSTSVAALAQAAYGGQAGVKAVTGVYDALLPDTPAARQEGRYAGLVAQALGIPICIQPGKTWDRDPAAAMAGYPPADPNQWPVDAERNQASLEHSRVILTGFGGDPLFRPQPDYLHRMLASGRLRQMLAEAMHQVQVHRVRPQFGLLSLPRRLFSALPGGAARQPKEPWWRATLDWLNPELVTRLALAERGAALDRARLSWDHPSHVAACHELLDPMWPNQIFWGKELGALGWPLEVRHPFFDLRLVKYVLAIPPRPWSERKFLLREAMRGRLPEPVRLRPKTPLDAPLPVQPEIIARWRHAAALPELARFVNIPWLRQQIGVVEQAGVLESEIRWPVRHSLYLGYWLDQPAVRVATLS
ncbi:MAG: asparagine synthetase B [Chloroflexi bacterium]|nr:asparagine synthetase B [Chloroflexota bacterium]